MLGNTFLKVLLSTFFLFGYTLCEVTVVFCWTNSEIDSDIRSLYVTLKDGEVRNFEAINIDHKYALVKLNEKYLMNLSSVSLIESEGQWTFAIEGMKNERFEQDGAITIKYSIDELSKGREGPPPPPGNNCCNLF